MNSVLHGVPAREATLCLAGSMLSTISKPSTRDHIRQLARHRVGHFGRFRRSRTCAATSKHAARWPVAPRATRPPSAVRGDRRVTNPQTCRLKSESALPAARATRCPEAAVAVGRTITNAPPGDMSSEFYET